MFYALPGSTGMLWLRAWLRCVIGARPHRRAVIVQLTGLCAAARGLRVLADPPWLGIGRRRVGTRGSLARSAQHDPVPVHRLAHERCEGGLIV